ncbi:hypothetical protein AB870_15920 [Pandoraea faecigallinarum]|nr:hypothetical protein AB870_15920 [Pandoraea faecigallinarum]
MRSGAAGNGDAPHAANVGDTPSDPVSDGVFALPGGPGKRGVLYRSSRSQHCSSFHHVRSAQIDGVGKPRRRGDFARGLHLPVSFVSSISSISSDFADFVDFVHFVEDQ